MKNATIILLIGLLTISLFSGCSEVFIYDDHTEVCPINPIIYTEGNPPSLATVTLPYSFSVPKCPATASRDAITNPAMCVDYRGECSELGCPIPCSDYSIPSNYICQDITEESYQLMIAYTGGGTIFVNGTPFTTTTSPLIIIFLDKPLAGGVGPTNVIIGIPSTITITANGEFGQEFGVGFGGGCCYSCRPRTLPATMLSAKVDIEAFQIVGGDTIIKDGKIVSKFNTSPGSQKTTIQVENRGFFTQRSAMVQFLGLPPGVAVDVTPKSQIIKAHNTADYEATFTVGPNVSSGTYKVTMLALSPNGTFDTIQIDLVIP